MCDGQPPSEVSMTRVGVNLPSDAPVFLFPISLALNKLCVVVLSVAPQGLLFSSSWVTSMSQLPIDSIRAEHGGASSSLFRTKIKQAEASGLYQSQYEHDACGVGFVAHIQGHATHEIVLNGLQILKNLDHRGAVGADPLMGDGAGILVQIPDALYREEMAQQGVVLPPPGEYGVGMIFLPKEHAARLACEHELERVVKAEGQIVLGWRDVPINRDLPMSDTVKMTEPVIRQLFVGQGPDVMVPDVLERKLYVIRKTASHAIRALGLKYGGEYFVPSMSARTVVYKGLLLADQVGEYFYDLKDERFTLQIVLIKLTFSPRSRAGSACSISFKSSARSKP